MDAFKHIIGHEDIKRYFNRALESDKISHSYIFEGIEGVGKKTTALALAKRLLCQGEDKPCGKCKACLLVDAHTHPDITVVEKDTKITKIDTIRDRVVKDMDTKPYQGPYKIVIIAEADTVTIEGQNAMLKTIEEPPSYGIVILITKNISKLLPTIKSRCIHLRFSPLNDTQIVQYLEPYPITTDKKMMYAQFSEGSIGIANKLLGDEVFLETRRQSIEYLRELERADMMGVYSLVKSLTENKDLLGEILEFWLLWYRDLAVLKSTPTNKLYYLDYQSSLLDTTSKLTYNVICRHIDLIRQAKLQIDQNIYPTFVIENLLLKLKERKK